MFPESVRPRNDGPLVVIYDLGSADPVRIRSSAARLCDVIFVCDRSSPHVADVIDQIVDVAQVLDVTGMDEVEICRQVSRLAPIGVLTCSERQLGRAAAVASACGVPFHSAETVELLTDKFRQRQALAAAGVPSARCVVVRGPAMAAEAAREVGLPAVVKPRIGAGSVDTCRVTTAVECAAAVSMFAEANQCEFVVEQMLLGDPSVAGERWGDYVSVESVVQGGQIQNVCISGKFPLAEPFRETGVFVPATISDTVARAVIEVERSALRALGVAYGVTHTEIKLTAAGPKVIEVNGRLGGYVGDVIRRAAGYDLLRAAVEVAIGRRVRVPSIRWREVAYQYFVVPPFGADRLLSLAGMERLHEVPGVRHVELHAEPGQRVRWRDGTRSHIGIVYGSASNHDGLGAATAELDARLKLVYQ